MVIVDKNYMGSGRECYLAERKAKNHAISKNVKQKHLLTCVAYFAQFEFEFLSRVRAWTSVDLLQGTGLEHCLCKILEGNTCLILVYTFDQCRFTYRHWSETRTRARNSISN